MHAERPSRHVRPIRRAFSSTALRAPAVLACVALASCHHAVTREVHSEISSQGRADSTVELSDSRPSYRRAGLLVSGGELPIVGAISFLAGAATDSTVLLIDVSISNRTLTFAREGETYHAAYDAVVELRQPGSPSRRIATHEQVRVGSLHET